MLCLFFRLGQQWRHSQRNERVRGADNIGRLHTWSDCSRDSKRTINRPIGIGFISSVPWSITCQTNSFLYPALPFSCRRDEQHHHNTLLWPLQNQNPNRLLLLIVISPWFCFCISIKSQLCQDRRQVIVRVAVASTPTKLP
jgi:hypothetical protein